MWYYFRKGSFDKDPAKELQYLLGEGVMIFSYSYIRTTKGDADNPPHEKGEIRKAIGTWLAGDSVFEGVDIDKLVPQYTGEPWDDDIYTCYLDVQRQTFRVFLNSALLDYDSKIFADENPDQNFFFEKPVK